MSRSPDELLALLEQAEKGVNGPPVEKWDPPLSGDMDMRIGADGTWYHEGDPIRRQGLVKLFASVLRKDGDDYVLVTPVEKWRIQVDDLPFVATTVERIDRDGEALLLFTTNVDVPVLVDQAHPLEMEPGENGAPRPRLRVRRNLYARINRPAFYQLVEWGEARPCAGGQALWVSSGELDFCLGQF